jgi:hypothetical protein
MPNNTVSTRELDLIIKELERLGNCYEGLHMTLDKKIEKVDTKVEKKLDASWFKWIIGLIIVVAIASVPVSVYNIRQIQKNTVQIEIMFKDINDHHKTSQEFYDETEKRLDEIEDIHNDLKKE